MVTILPIKVSIPRFKDLIIEGYSEVKSRSLTSEYNPGIGSSKYPPAYESFFLIVFGFLMGLRVRSAQKKYQIQKECEDENINYKTTYQALSNKDFSKLKEIVLEYTPALRTYLDNEEEEKTNPLLAEHVNNALVAPIDRNASSLFKFIVILVWIASFLLPIVLAYNINSLKF